MVVTDHPLLIFPEHSETRRSKLSGGGGTPNLPEPSRQSSRLKPKFDSVQHAFDRQRVTLQDNPLGIEPEQVLVLEIVGSIADFIRAVSHIDGLELLGEFDVDEIEAAYGFGDESDSPSALKGQFFLVMTDQRALRKIRSLFDDWCDDPSIRFPDGFGKFKNMFRQLYDIRPWDANDRFYGTGVIDDWNEMLAYGEQRVYMTVELWHTPGGDRQSVRSTNVSDIIIRLGGTILHTSVIPEIDYHAILAEIPAERARLLLDEAISAGADLVECQDVMYVRSAGQCAVPVQIEEALVSAEHSTRDDMSQLPAGDPIVAVFDGLPLAGHQLIDGRVVIDDPDDYERGYSVSNRYHGTAITSLICHGDLNEGNMALSRPVYVRPIMQPHTSFNGEAVEQIPNNVLAVDLIWRAVRRLFEPEGEFPAVAPGIRVINLSVCDRSRQFNRGMSPLAKLIDWLSSQYNVLFVVSAGNHIHDLPLEIPRDKVSEQSPETFQRAVLRAIARDTRNRPLLSPGETVNGLTLGSAHADASPSPPLSNHWVDPLHTGLPSVVSAHGPGYRASIKPDVLAAGGKQLLYEKIVADETSAAVLEVRPSTLPPGQLAAVPSVQTGQLDRVGYFRGTSNAAALASRGAGMIFESIDQLRERGGADIDFAYDSVLMKALLVHSADWLDLFSTYDKDIRDLSRGKFKNYISRFVGYGQMALQRSLVCTDHRVTAIGYGDLTDGVKHKFEFPLPPSLSGTRLKRRLKITLAWFTPINIRNLNYRIAHLWFEASNEFAKNKRICADLRATRRGTVQHEVFEGTQALEFQDGERIAIEINCRSDAGDIVTPIRYGIAVTLDVADEIDVSIYQEVQDRLAVRVPA